MICYVLFWANIIKYYIYFNQNKDTFQFISSPLPTQFEFTILLKNEHNMSLSNFQKYDKYNVFSKHLDCYGYRDFMDFL